MSIISIIASILIGLLISASVVVEYYKMKKINNIHRMVNFLMERVEKCEEEQKDLS